MASGYNNDCLKLIRTALIGHLAQQGKGAGISSIKPEELIDAVKHEDRIYELRNGVLMPTEGGK
jgi:hypothetical protein